MTSSAVGDVWVVGRAGELRSSLSYQGREIGVTHVINVAVQNFGQLTRCVGTLSAEQHDEYRYLIPRKPLAFLEEPKEFRPSLRSTLRSNLRSPFFYQCVVDPRPASLFGATQQAQALQVSQRPAGARVSVWLMLRKAALSTRPVLRA